MATSAQLFQAALLLAGRFYRAPDAPFGVVGTLELGTAYIRNAHPDVAALLFGWRSRGVPDDQVWPTAEEVAQTALNTSWGSLTAERQAALTTATAAAVEWITAHVEPAPDDEPAAGVQGTGWGVA